MREKYIHILKAEESIARRITLGILVKRPVKPLFQLIPGMFIFDFLKRNSEIRRYSQYYLPPRKLALDMALDIAVEGGKDGTFQEVDRKVRDWLETQGLFNSDTNQSLVAIVHFLIAHYVKLIEANGATYNDLIKNAYSLKGNYEIYLDQLASLEKDFTQAVSKKLDDIDDIRQKLFIEHKEADNQRKREIGPIFFD